MSKSKTPTTVHLSQEARDALARLAQRDGRSLSGWIEATIRTQAIAEGAWVPRRLTAVPKSERGAG